MTTITLSLPDNSSSLYRRLYQEAGGPGVPSSVSSHSQVEKLGERWTAVWLAPISTRPVCPLTDLQLSHFEPLCSRQTRKPECRRHVAQCRHHWGYCVEAGGWVTVIVFLHVHFSRREICVCTRIDTCWGWWPQTKAVVCMHIFKTLRRIFMIQLVFGGVCTQRTDATAGALVYLFKYTSQWVHRQRRTIRRTNCTNVLRFRVKTIMPKHKQIYTSTHNEKRTSITQMPLRHNRTLVPQVHSIVLFVMQRCAGRRVC